MVSRLEGRPSLRDIEPNIFPVDSGPRQGAVQNGGLEVGVVFIDTDYHFDMLRLVSALEGRLAEDLKFYWVDRFSGGESTVCQEANLRKCTELLDRLRTLSSSHRWRSAESASDFDKPYLCRAWQRIVTHRMLFTKSPVSNDHKQVFSTACTSIMTKGVKRCSFHVMEDGIKFVCDK
ncbi:hypothetical protein PO909_016840 [Leuciscus waleckii]